MNYQEEVLKVYPDARAEQTPTGYYYISSISGKLSMTYLLEQIAWEQAYKDMPKSIPITVTGCEDCPMRHWASVVYCLHPLHSAPAKYNYEELHEQCPLKQNSITIKLKENE